MPTLPRAAAIQMVPNTPLTTPTKQDRPSNAPMSARRRFQSPIQSFRQMRQRRRSRSAPPKLRQPLIEHHFRVDSERKVILPGVPKHEDDWYRDTHDFFNLIVLIPIIVLDVMNWNWDTLFNLKKKQTFADAWTGDYFYAFFGLTVAYFLADLLWILLVPKCVRSPSTIIQHHIATILYMMVPYFTPDLRWCMGACISVEINTWFLIARRVFNKAGFPPWVIDLSFVSIRVKLISIGFYVTWIAIRCILYPVMMVFIMNRWWSHTQKIGTYFNIELINPILHSTFCLLNLKWTYDLVMSKIRYYKRRALYQSKGLHLAEDKASKGL